jgi:hypothetical protein
MQSLLTASTASLLIGLWLVPGVASGQLSSSIKPPETFYANAQVLGQDAGLAATVTVRIEQYTRDRDRKTMQDALQTGGFEGFLPALRKAPEIGYIEMNGRKVTARWARQEANPKGRTISVVADAPLYFVGGGGVEAKPRGGFELAVILLEVDEIGLGTGRMAPAARVSPGGPTGVQIDDYGAKPVKLVTVRKSFK